MPTERLQVILEMSASQYKREAKEAAAATGVISTQAKTAATQTGTLTSKMAGFGSVVKGFAVAGGIALLGSGLRNAVNAAEEAAAAVANTEAIIRSTGGVANVTAEDIDNLSRRLASLTGVEDDVVREGANVLLTFRNVRNEAGQGNDVFDRTLGLMLDIGAIMGTDASSAALQLGKALNDPVSQMGALSRAGLTFSAAQKKQIKDLVASNDLLSAQKLILTELETQMGGAAAASVTASDRISSSLGEIAEAVGTGLLPILDDVADGLAILAGMSPSVSGLADTVKELGEINLSDMFQVGEILGITNWRDAMEEVIATADLTDEELRELADGGMKQLREEYDLSGRRAEILADIINDELRKGLETSIGAANRHRKSIEDTAEAYDLAAVKTGVYVRELQNLRDRQLEMIDPALAAINALDRYESALEASEAAIKEHGAESKEARDAGLDLLESYSGLIASAQQYADVAGVSLKNALQNIGTQAGLSEGQIESLIAMLGRLDRLVVRPRIEIRTPEGISVREGNVIRRASGGPLGYRQPALVGERGPELFVPNAAGQVISTHDLQRLASLGSRTSNNNYNIPIQSSGIPETDAQLVGAVASVLRRMETI